MSANQDCVTGLTPNKLALPVPKPGDANRPYPMACRIKQQRRRACLTTLAVVQIGLGKDRCRHRRRKAVAKLSCSTGLQKLVQTQSGNVVDLLQGGRKLGYRVVAQSLLEQEEDTFLGMVAH